MRAETEFKEKINKSMENFKVSLQHSSARTMVRRYVTYGECCLLDETSYFELKVEIANQFRIHPTEIIMVGSGKLGFSIAPKKLYREFGETSDIDIAIISQTLFDSFWISAYDYWQSKAYWPAQDEFKNYLFRGWMRPDKLPRHQGFEPRTEWFEFFQSLTEGNKYGPYKIAGGLYRTWYFLENYHSNRIQDIKNLGA